MGEAATNPIMSITATPPEAFILKLPDETLARILEFVYEACYEDAVASKYGIPFYYINPVEHYSVASANARFAPLTIVCRRLHPAATSRLYANLSVTNGHLCYRTDGYCDQLRHCQRAVLSSILLRRTLSGSKSLRDLCQVLFLCDMRQSCQTGNSHTVQRKNVTDGTIRTESAVSLVRDSIVHHVEGLPGPSVLDTMIDDFAVWLKRVKSVRLCVHDISEEKEKTGHLLELMLPSMQNLQCLSIRTLEDGWARGANLPQLFRSLQSTDWMTRLRKLEIQDTYDSRCMAHRSEMWASFRKAVQRCRLELLHIGFNQATFMEIKGLANDWPWPLKRMVFTSIDCLEEWTFFLTPAKGGTVVSGEFRNRDRVDLFFIRHEIFSTVEHVIIRTTSSRRTAQYLQSNVLVKVQFDSTNASMVLHTSWEDLLGYSENFVNSLYDFKMWLGSDNTHILNRVTIMTDARLSSQRRKPQGYTGPSRYLKEKFLRTAKDCNAMGVRLSWEDIDDYIGWLDATEAEVPPESA